MPTLIVPMTAYVWLSSTDTVPDATVADIDPRHPCDILTLIGREPRRQSDHLDHLEIVGIDHVQLTGDSDGTKPILPSGRKATVRGRTATLKWPTTV